MKNILIPTTYDTDTIDALKIAADMCQHSSGQIILMSVSDISDSISELLFLSLRTNVDLTKRDRVVDLWNTYKREHNLNASLKLHHQYGLSRPIMKQIIERFHIDMVIVPQSFQTSKSYIHPFTLKLLNQCSSPMMLLPTSNFQYKAIQRALYLDKVDQASGGVVQHYPFHVIHQSMIEKREDDSIQTLIEKMQIDLIVKEKRTADTADENMNVERLGLPILTI